MLTVITNNQPRDIIDAWELTKKEREDFGYLDWCEIEAGNTSRSFFRYKGELYDLDEFFFIGDGYPNELWNRWDGIQSDTFFSGILVKYANDFEQVVVGRYYS